MIDIKYRSRYQSQGLMYRCIVSKDGSTRRSRWFNNREDAYWDALFWHKYYGKVKVCVDLEHLKDITLSE